LPQGGPPAIALRRRQSTQLARTNRTGQSPTPDPEHTHPRALRAAKKQFSGSADIDPVQAKKQFADLVDEVVRQFTARSGVAVAITVEIRANSAAGFEDELHRLVKENRSVLRFTVMEFEE
jgi:hypothetical protein